MPMAESQQDAGLAGRAMAIAPRIFMKMPASGRVLSDYLGRDCK
ncbi:hypothetical protein NSU_1528 [Novosphingobium pentaromativorans US6-1]|uniref:Uncharacterized protein n=1 Tax=Novosphingobium pentaromativorans US6-1 TaxID=1088721 RepID=G6EB07_9SPHN|nr:hypothetical protein NSU_1528 [Novosphingobium pentaromativorans US6-1]